MKFQKIEYGTERWFNLENLLNEKWKNIKGFKNIYQISNYGRLKSLRLWVGNKYYKRELILHFDKQNGYFCTKLFNNKSKKYKYIHRLVAENFIKNDNNCKNVIDHIDANKLNNRIDNLEWVTSKENNRRAREMGLTKFSQETINKLKQNAIKNNSARFLLPYAELRKRKIYQYDLNDNFITFYESIDEAKKIYGKSAHIVDCCQGKRKQSKGYKWRYANEDNN